MPPFETSFRWAAGQWAVKLRGRPSAYNATTEVMPITARGLPRACASALEVQCDVEGRGRVREPADRDEVDPGFGDGADGTPA